VASDPTSPIKARGSDTRGALGVVETVIPRGHGPPLHVHRNEDEGFYVLSGSIEILRGEERFRAEPGTFVYLPRDVPHTFLGIDETRILGLVMPAGLEEAFEDPDRFDEVLTQRGVEVVGRRSSRMARSPRPEAAARSARAATARTPGATPSPCGTAPRRHR
jgi:mannose-6-phosphate isomerase-like protein (cupin superfamily)